MGVVFDTPTLFIDVVGFAQSRRFVLSVDWENAAELFLMRLSVERGNAVWSYSSEVDNM